MTTTRQASVRRPSERWLVISAVLVGLSVYGFFGSLAWLHTGATETDGEFWGGSGDERVASPPHEERMLFESFELGVDCTIRDGSGSERPLHKVDEEVTVLSGGDKWTGVATFDSGDGDLTVTCIDMVSGGDGPMRIGTPEGTGYRIALVSSIAGPILVGGLGAMILILTTVLYFTRPKD